MTAESLMDAAPIQSWPNHWPKPGRAMRHLNSALALKTEGKAMNHCVGSYVESVEDGHSIILSINTKRGGRSTVELDQYNHVRQHYGPNNERPSELNRKYLDAWLKRFKL